MVRSGEVQSLAFKGLRQAQVYFYVEKTFCNTLGNPGALAC